VWVLITGIGSATPASTMLRQLSLTTTYILIPLKEKSFYLNVILSLPKEESRGGLRRRVGLNNRNWLSNAGFDHGCGGSA